MLILYWCMSAKLYWIFDFLLSLIMVNKRHFPRSYLRSQLTSAVLLFYITGVRDIVTEVNAADGW